MVSFLMSANVLYVCMYVYIQSKYCTVEYR